MDKIPELTNSEIPPNFEILEQGISIEDFYAKYANPLQAGQNAYVLAKDGTVVEVHVLGNPAVDSDSYIRPCKRGKDQIPVHVCRLGTFDKSGQKQGLYLNGTVYQSCLDQELEKRVGDRRNLTVLERTDDPREKSDAAEVEEAVSGIKEAREAEDQKVVDLKTQTLAQVIEARKERKKAA